MIERYLRYENRSPRPRLHILDMLAERYGALASIQLPPVVTRSDDYFILPLRSYSVKIKAVGSMASTASRDYSMALYFEPQVSSLRAMNKKKFTETTPLSTRMDILQPCQVLLSARYMLFVVLLAKPLGRCVWASGFRTCTQITIIASTISRSYSCQ